MDQRLSEAVSGCISTYLCNCLLMSWAKLLFGFISVLVADSGLIAVLTPERVGLVILQSLSKEISEFRWPSFSLNWGLEHIDVVRHAPVRR